VLINTRALASPLRNLHACHWLVLALFFAYLFGKIFLASPRGQIAANRGQEKVKKGLTLAGELIYQVGRDLFQSLEGSLGVRSGG
jgi:hypothetical protein